MNVHIGSTLANNENVYSCAVKRAYTRKRINSIYNPLIYLYEWLLKRGARKRTISLLCLVVTV